MVDSLSEAVTIERVIRETQSVKTFVLNKKFEFYPGQFVMVWIPGIDEIPMALSAPNAISVQRVGDATEALFALSAGDMLGIRGPFGTWFPDTGEILAICGGIGAAPLLHLARSDCINTFLLGGRTEEELPFVDILDECTNLLIATNDGSLGFGGMVTDLVRDHNLVNLESFDVICTCGPEPMMRVVLALLNEKHISERGFFSLHRYMKCGIGVCGSCCIDPKGWRVCREGPVFRGDTLLESEFGRYVRDESGQKRMI